MVDVQVFAAHVDVPDTERARLAALLSPDEVERARRFLFDTDRDRFIVARASLRTILATSLNTDPRAIHFEYGQGGKPRIDRDLSFNLSHAGALVLIAVGWGGRIGIDVERVRGQLATPELERYCFARSEIVPLVDMEPSARRRAFFQCWTRKESYLKAIGTGITVPLDAVAVVPLSERHGVSRVIAADAGGDWSVHDLPVPAGYAAAIALDRPRPVGAVTWTCHRRGMDCPEQRRTRDAIGSAGGASHERN